MEFGVGSILEGKVTGITKFGAFVSLPEGRSGLVHISEIAYSYVNEVSDHLQEGQQVKVKVIGIDDSKIDVMAEDTIKYNDLEYAYVALDKEDVAKILRECL